MDDFILNLTKKLGKPELVDIFNAQVESIKDGRNDIFEDENAFLRWFTENVLYPERRIFLQNTLKKAFKSNDLVDELKSELSAASASIFENLKNRCDKDTIYNFVKIVNSMYIINNYESEYESPGSKLTTEDVDFIFKDYAGMIENGTYLDEFKEVLDWIDDFVYYQHFESKVLTKEAKKEVNVIKDTLRNAIEIKDFLPEIIDILDEESKILIGQLKEAHTKEEMEDLYKGINSAYIVNYFSHKYENDAQNQNITSEDINSYFRDLMEQFSQRSDEDSEFNEMIEWVDDFVYSNSDDFLF